MSIDNFYKVKIQKGFLLNGKEIEYNDVYVMNVTNTSVEAM